MSFITVSGLAALDIEYPYASKELPVIGCQKTGLKQKCNYVVVNSINSMDDIVTQNNNTTIVATKDAFSKYIWHDNVELYPVIHDIINRGFDLSSASLQQLALALACYMGNPTIYLVGYQLDTEKETPFLQNILRLYPKTKFAFIRKPNPQKIELFKQHENIVIEDTNIFRKLIQNVTK